MSDTYERTKDREANEDVDIPAGPPPALSDTLSQDERYFTLFTTAIHRCLTYKPKFGMGKSSGLAVKEFRTLYQADPFYNWLGLDSPLMYAAHKAAGGMTSVYRQIGIGSQWIFSQILVDMLELSTDQTAWSYTVATGKGKNRKLSLDGRIDLSHIQNLGKRAIVKDWVQHIGETLGLEDEIMANIKGVVFEARQGYKSKDSKRQNADINNATQAYTRLYIPAILLFSTQIDGDVANRYRENLWLILTGSLYGSTVESTYAFCRDIIGYDLGAFFTRYSPKLKAEVENVLQALLSA